MQVVLLYNNSLFNCNSGVFCRMAYHFITIYTALLIYYSNKVGMQVLTIFILLLHDAATLACELILTWENWCIQG